MVHGDNDRLDLALLPDPETPTCCWILSLVLIDTDKKTNTVTLDQKIHRGRPGSQGRKKNLSRVLRVIEADLGTSSSFLDFTASRKSIRNLSSSRTIPRLT